MSVVAADERLSLRRLHWQRMAARDGVAGELFDVLFEDQSWWVRYLVIDTIGAMPRRDLLVRPAQVESVTPLRLALTREELKRCPELGEERPVYLQQETGRAPRTADPRLRSAEIILGFAVREGGRAAGRVIDVELDAGRWLPGRRRTLEARTVRAIDWIARTIDLG